MKELNGLSTIEKGSYFFQAGDLKLAEVLFRLSIKLDGESADAYNNLGLISKRNEDIELSIDYFLKALSVDNHHFSASYNLSQVYDNIKNPQKALYYVDIALRASPFDLHALSLKSKVHTDLKDYDNALKYIEIAYNANPEDIDVLHSYGAVLLEMSDYDTAEKILNQAIELAEHNPRPDILFNLMIINVYYARYEDAEQIAKQILRIDPDHKNIMAYLTIFELLNLRFKSGWIKHEKRSVIEPPECLAKPVYEIGKFQSVLITAEQGIGDEIIFASVIPDIANDCNKVILQCDKRLINLFANSFPSNVNYVEKNAAVQNIDYDSHIRVGSLPSLYRNNIKDFKFSASGYLRSNSSLTESLRSDLKSFSQKPIVGISWKSFLDRRLNRSNSLTLKEMLHHLKDLNATFVNIQYGEVEEEIIEATATLDINFLHDKSFNLMNNIDYLSSLICACDYIITSPNLNISLAGALGIKTHLVLPKGGDRWKWGMQGTTSYWFDSLEIHRQDIPGEWSGALSKLSKALS